MSKDAVIKTTTLAELGATPPDVSGSLNAPLTIKKKTLRSGETVYLASVDRPLIGPSLAYLVNSISKVNFGRLDNSEGIVDDLRLPEQARDNYADPRIKKRDLDHRNSFFGKEYAEIDRSHRQSWISAFYHKPEPIREVTNFFSKLHDRHIDAIVGDSRRGRTVYGEGTSTSDWLLFIASGLYTILGDGEFRRLNSWVGSQLTPEQIMDFVIKSDLGSKTIVDFDKQHVRPSSFVSSGKLTVVPPNKLIWQADHKYSYAVNASFHADINGPDLKWSLDNYTINFKRPDDFEQASIQKHSLNPLIAWITNQDGQRRYITQTRVRSMKWHGLPDNSDVLLGRVLAAHLTPGIPEIWQERMAHSKNGEKNDIMGAQALVLASLPHPNFGGKVLRDPEGVLAKIEAGLAV